MNNIKIGEDLANNLITASIGDYSFGSVNGNDEDKVYILPNYDFITLAPFNTHHWLHYKGDFGDITVDYLFCTMSDFYHALIEGTSHIPMEVVLCNYPLDGVLSFIGEPDAYLNSFKVMKIYLGLARKDIKQGKEFLKKDSLEKAKKKSRFIVNTINLCKSVLPVGDFYFEEIQTGDKNKNQLGFAFDDYLTMINRMRMDLTILFDDGKIPAITDRWRLEYALALDNKVVSNYKQESWQMEVIEFYFNNVGGL